MNRPPILAAYAIAVLWLCQFLTVRYNYGGNWTGLFCIAPHMPVPDFLRSERLYIFPNSDGYDGQIFHLIAHDPWMTRGSADSIVGAAFRYQRILVPALAWTLALGRDEHIHAAYIAVILGFAFAGVFWLARLAQLRGLHPAWGLAFLAVPATITSLDRMTADIALAAFCVGFALYVESGSPWRVVLILACAALTRETAVLIVIGYCIFLLTRNQIARSIAAGCALLPTGAWFLYVTHGAANSAAIKYLGWVPLSGFVERIVHPAVYPLAVWKNDLARLFDFVALAGVALVLIAVARMAARRRWNAEAAAIYALALAVIFLHRRDVWEDAYAFGRVLSPLLLLTFVQRLGFAALAPMVLIDLRISLNIGVELEGIVRGLLK
ncbi:MAG: hypothetical protein ABSF22_14295 [Bryobacteraceae bacterium]